MRYREIRTYQTTSLLTEFLICPYCQLLSPFFTNFFVKKGIIPNMVTVFMIISGILGAAFFAIPNLVCQIIGTILIHIWFVLDCSDGEVARITKTFSTFGKELDYTAHVINHPFFSLAFISAMYFSGHYNMVWVFAFFVVFSILEWWSRHICIFIDVHNLKLPPQESEEEKCSLRKAILTFILNSLLAYPNFALIFPLLFFLDLALGSQIAFYFLGLYVVANLLLVPKIFYGWIKVMVKK